MTLPGLLLLLLFVVGLALRFKGLTFQSLWLDELDALRAADPELTLPQVLEFFTSNKDFNPPLYNVVLHLWLIVFGFSELAARSLSAILGALGILAICLLGKELHGRTCGLLAALILCCNPFQLHYSQEVRSYTLLFLLASLSGWALARSMRTAATRDFVVYAAVSTAMVYTHHYGVLALISHGLFVAVYLPLHRVGRVRRRLALGFAASWLGIGAVYAPWIPVVLRVSKKQFPMKPPSKNFLFEYFQRFFGGEQYLVLMVAAMIVVALALASRSRPQDDPERSARRDFAVPLLFTWIFVCLFLPYLRSVAVAPMLNGRYAMVVVPAIIVLAAIGIAELRNRALILLLATSALLASCLNVFYHQDYYAKKTKERWRDVAEFTIKTTQEKCSGRSLLFVSDWANRFNIYFRLLGSSIQAERATREERFRSILKKHGDAVDGIWVLTAHRPIWDGFPVVLQSNGFSVADELKLGTEEAVLYLRKDLEVGPPGAASEP